MGASYSNSCYLFAMPSFKRGLSKVLDIGSTLTVYNNQDDPKEADLEMLGLDWEQVGNDLFEAIDKYERA